MPTNTPHTPIRRTKIVATLGPASDRDGVLEAMIAAVQEQRWPETRERYEQLDELFDMTRLFRKFV
jgi:pyruvate kinase